LFGQSIDYSKCSCDSIARHHSTIKEKETYKFIERRRDSLKTTLSPVEFVSPYNGFTRTVNIDNYYFYIDHCIYVNEYDSIVVKYTSNKVYSNRLKTANIDYRTHPEIVPYDSSVYHIDLYGKIISSEHYHWGYNPYLQSPQFRYRFDIYERTLKTASGKDSIFYGYYDPIYLLNEISKKDSIRMSKKYEPILRVYYTEDDSGYYHGKFISYRENGKIVQNVDYKHGVIDGYYYYSDGGTWCQCKGRFVNGKQRGRWRYKYYPVFRKPYIEILWFGRSGKIYRGRIIPIKKVSNEYIEVLCGEHPASKIIDGFFNIIDKLNR
jgi:antitoxin component YwqK of YwqJK toxin-antitoxin module